MIRLTKREFEDLKVQNQFLQYLEDNGIDPKNFRSIIDRKTGDTIIKRGLIEKPKKMVKPKTKSKAKKKGK